MSVPNALSRHAFHLALLAALFSAACQAAPAVPGSTFQLDRQAAASLVVAVAPETDGYKALYLPVTDWDYVEGELAAPGLAAPVKVRADAEIDPDTQRRAASLTFADLPAGDGFTLTVTLYRQGTGDAPEVVGQEVQTALGIASGVNHLTFSKLFRKQAEQAAAAPTLLASLVTSLPGNGMVARLDNPADVVVDAKGILYILDSNNGGIRRCLPDGQGHTWVTNLVGTGYPGYAEGVGLAARLAYPGGMAMGPDGNLYVADIANSRIRKVTIDANGQATVSSIGGVNGAGEANPGATATFSQLATLTVDGAGVIYLGEKTRIRKLVPGANGVYTVTTYAGGTTAGYEDGNGVSAKFDSIRDLALDAQDVLYVADAGAVNRVRRVAPSGGGSSVSTVPMPVGLTFNQPGCVAFDADGKLVVGDVAKLYRFDVSVPGTPVVENLAGASAGFADGQGTAAAFNNPSGLAVTAEGIWVADRANHRVRLVRQNPTGGWTATTRVGDGTNGNMNGEAVPNPPLGRPTSVALGADGTIYLADPIKQQVLAIDPAGQAVRVVAGTGGSGSKDGAAEQATFNGPAGVAVSANGDLWVTDAGNGSLRRLKRDAEGRWAVSTVVTGLSYPGGVIEAPDGSLFLTESGHPSIVFLGSHRVRKVTFGATGQPTVTTIAGGSNGFADGAGASARFTRPTGLALAADGTLYVADAENHRIRTITFDANGVATVATLVGTGAKGTGGADFTNAQFDRPTGLVFDGPNRLVVTDYWNCRLQVLSLTDRKVKTLVGNGDGYSDGPVSQARFSRPVAIARDAAGNFYVADAHPGGVRKVQP